MTISNQHPREEIKKEDKPKCTHKKTNYDCPCWFEGYLMGGAEAGFNRNEIKERIEGMKVKREYKTSATYEGGISNMGSDYYYDTGYNKALTAASRAVDGE